MWFEFQVLPLLLSYLSWTPASKVMLEGGSQDTGTQGINSLSSSFLGVAIQHHLRYWCLKKLCLQFLQGVFQQFINQWFEPLISESVFFLSMLIKKKDRKLLTLWLLAVFVALEHYLAQTSWQTVWDFLYQISCATVLGFISWHPGSHQIPFSRLSCLQNTHARLWMKKCLSFFVVVMLFVCAEGPFTDGDVRSDILVSYFWLFNTHHQFISPPPAHHIDFMS